MKAFVVDLDKCVGCYGCQIGCKDEHVGNDWAPLAASQPETGHFWMRVKQRERGQRPHVKVTYLPVLCQHCDTAPCIKAAPDAVYKRPDGLVIIDPVAAKGKEELVKACPYGAIFWNAELQLPQKCSGCAHLLDGDHPIKTPRCVDNCQTDALQFGEEDELDLTDVELLEPGFATQPRVFYRHLPKRFVAGTVYDPQEKEVIVGATVRLEGEVGSFGATTDAFGDFWLKDLPKGEFELTIESLGRQKTMQVSTVEKDVGLADIPLGKC